MSEDFKPIAKKILEKHPIWTIRENKSMWIYDGSPGKYFFVPNAETYIGEICVHSDAYNVRSFYSGLLFTIKQMTWIEIDKFESGPNYINLKNGVYDIVDDKILDPGPKYKFKNNLGIEYNASALCPIFEAMVKSMTKTQEDCDLIQRWFGYQLFRGSRLEKKSLFIHGPPDVGKSTLLWVLQKINGEGGYTTHSLRDISNDIKYYIADLYGKSANINSDMSAIGPKDVSLFKQLTGGDKITARKIRGMPFKFDNQAKLTFACNYFPYIKESIVLDKAFWNRIMAITVQKGYDQEDKYIKDKLCNELPGILNWAIKGLKDYIKYGFSCYNKNWEETKEIWMKNFNPAERDRRYISEDELFKFHK